MSVSIVAKQLGFDSVILYVECCGWMFWTQGGKATIQYCQLEQVIAHLAPKGEMVELVMNFKAMVDKLYTYVEQQGIKNIYTHKPAVRFLKKNSFIAKLHQQMQEWKVAFVIVKTFFLLHVSSQMNQLDYWVKRIFCPCHI